MSFLLIANPVFAQGPNAVIYGGPQVTVNGKSLVRSQVGQPGDEIRTAADSASIIAKGNNVQLRPNTVVSLGDHNLDLTCGTALVRTIDSFTTHVQKYTISPHNQTAQYRVSRGAGRIVVSALQNVIDVSDGSTGFNVLPGGSRTLDDPQGATQCPLPAPVFEPAAMSTNAALAWWILPAGVGGAIGALVGQGSSKKKSAGSAG